MVRYNIDDVTEGMVLGESIFLPGGDLLLAAGYHIKEYYRSRLKQLGFASILIEVEGTEGVCPESVISAHVQREASASLDKTAKELNSIFRIKERGEREVEHIVKENGHEIGKFIMSTGMQNALEKFIEEIMNQSSVILNLSALTDANASFFAHAINVTIISLCIGKKYRFSYDEMKQIAMGAINFDLGLAAVSRDILKKEDPLTDEERKSLEQHTVYGYMMLSKSTSIPATSAAVALQHHEWQDGSGYPRSLSGLNMPPIKDFNRANVIHRFAEIVAVADTYDMLTNGRVHFSPQYSTAEAIKKMIQLSGTQLNTDIVKTLLSIVPVYPVGARVRVVKAPTPQLVGYNGVVARQHAENLERPEVILYETRLFQKIKPVLIDLEKHAQVEIELVA